MHITCAAFARERRAQKIKCGADLMENLIPTEMFHWAGGEVHAGGGARERRCVFH